MLCMVEKLHCQNSVNIGNSQIVGHTVYTNGNPVVQFLGIPYAEPPTGPLRFKKPVPRKIFTKIYFAINHPPSCWQASEYPFPSYDSHQRNSEDCLYLNIWKPVDASQSNKKAVIYYIHGGGFRFGSISQMVYNGAPLAAHGDVIVVTVNFRLGAFGFLTSGTEDAPGNMALYDILEGLRWVNENIETFGGDKSRITIGGQEADNGERISAYLDENNKEKNMYLSQKVAERLFCANETYTLQDNPSEVLKCLRTASAAGLTDVSATIDPLSGVLFAPQFGDDLLPVDPRKAVQDKNMTCNEVLIGVTQDEGSFQVAARNPETFGLNGYQNPQVNRSEGEQMILQNFQNYPDPEAIVKQYLPSSLSNSSYKKIREQVYTASGDASIVCPSEYYAEKCAAEGGDVYFYVWEHRPSNSPWAPWMGVTHFSEVEFVFGLPLLHPYYFTPDELELCKSTVNIWSSFAKTGKPDIPWPEYSKSNPQVKYLGPGASTDQNAMGFHSDNCNFFRSYYGF
ncbi:acetylcholinesterase-1 [Caerostris extrusa]|uniref:acetylcholinesterase n=1 Tax=Caerostris extrusa TaxID=172846 RepID=A0AAV4MB59_CAEEX|nr:acetylcholinesterase-1 [Caerostris extrusa]